jgi:hypothetical protein
MKIEDRPMLRPKRPRQRAKPIQSARSSENPGLAPLS